MRVRIRWLLVFGIVGAIILLGTAGIIYDPVLAVYRSSGIQAWRGRTQYTAMLKKLALAAENEALGDATVTVRLVDADRLGAWTHWEFSNRPIRCDILFGRSLFEILTEEEIAAVLAHELGHPALKTVNEERADAFALSLLRRAGYDPHALASFMKKVASRDPDAIVERRLERVEAILRGDSSPQ